MTKVASPKPSAISHSRIPDLLLREPAALDNVPDKVLSLFPEAGGFRPLRRRVRRQALRPRAESMRRRSSRKPGKGSGALLQEFIPRTATHIFSGRLRRRHGRVCGMLARRRCGCSRGVGNSTFPRHPLARRPPRGTGPAQFARRDSVPGGFSASFSSTSATDSSRCGGQRAPLVVVGFAASCGVDVCQMAIRDALGEDVAAVSQYAVGRRCVHGRRDLATWRRKSGPDRLSLPSLLRSWIGAEQLTLCWDDPRPGLREIGTWSSRKLRGNLRW